jgi:hypothetical protein
MNVRHMGRLVWFIAHKLGVYPIPDIARLEWWLDVDERFKKWEQEDARRRGK